MGHTVMHTLDLRGIWILRAFYCIIGSERRWIHAIIWQSCDYQRLIILSWALSLEP